MSDDQESKTEQASGKRLGEAREKGNVLQSRDVSNLILLMTIAAVIGIVIPQSIGTVADRLAQLIAQADRWRLDDAQLGSLMMELATQVGLVVALPVLLLMVVGIGSSVAQFGLLWNVSALMPDLNKLNPATGFKRLFSMRSVIELLKNIGKIALVGGVCFLLLTPELRQVETLLSIGLGSILNEMLRITLRILIGVIITVAFIALADYMYQRFEFFKNLKMSKQEVKDEHKDSEGDPAIKGRLRQLRMEKARKRMMSAVPHATVVVTNPTHYAVALFYDQTLAAPKVVAKGADLVAKRIRDLAMEHFVPIVENPPLARTLFATVELEQEVPHEHYKAVAEVIGYVMRLRRQAVR